MSNNRIPGYDYSIDYNKSELLLPLYSIKVLNEKVVIKTSSIKNLEKEPQCVSLKCIKINR